MIVTEAYSIRIMSPSTARRLSGCLSVRESMSEVDCFAVLSTKY